MYRFCRITATLILLLCIVTKANSQAKADTLTSGQKQTQELLEKLLKGVQDAKKAAENESLGNIVIDQTKTRVGKEFFDMLNQQLEVPETGNDFVIVIDERPSMATTTIINININDVDVYSSYLQPKTDLLEESVTEAVETVIQFIKNYQQVLIDLSSKEQKGSGIF